MNTMFMLEAFNNPVAMENIKKDFQNSFMKIWKQQEKEYCAVHGIDSAMDNTKATEVMGYLARCSTPFHVEALKRIVLRDFQMPINYAEVEERANQLMTEALT